ncbi:hypothetical protein [Methylobacterium sp. J-070]|uniref:hypothetical protein n=1 Tax=Methylobacterium sp. J-070 TaxID=2836650 RepID=UPI001FB8C7CE|nr:hypothetical protein [Methylobacterium sp. J-070]MCJ2049157.1 hypothetical protein [Methylobacterium sp. J-070]
MAENQVAVAGLFEDYATAATAVQELESGGLHGIEISLVANDADLKHAKRLDETAQSRAVTGAAIGSVLGGSITALAALTALAIPGVGPVVAGGFVAAALGGATVGGLAGALIGSGLGADDADVYAEGIRRGGTLVVVRTPEAQVAQIEAFLNHAGAVAVAERAAAWREAGTGGRA